VELLCYVMEMEAQLEVAKKVLSLVERWRGLL
jgi:hypothetical protein